MSGIRHPREALGPTEGPSEPQASEEDIPADVREKARALARQWPLTVRKITLALLEARAQGFEAGAASREYERGEAERVGERRGIERAVQLADALIASWEIQERALRDEVEDEHADEIAHEVRGVKKAVKAIRALPVEPAKEKA